LCHAPPGATLQVLQEAQQAMGLEDELSERLLTHVGEPAAAPEVSPARPPETMESNFNREFAKV
jgi:hypothetical protein